VMDNYYDVVHGWQVERETEIRRLIEIVLRAPKWGDGLLIPNPFFGRNIKFRIEWKSLKQMSEPEKAGLKKTYAELDEINIRSEVYSQDEARKRWEGEGFNQDLTLDSEPEFDPALMSEFATDPESEVAGLLPGRVEEVKPADTIPNGAQLSEARTMVEQVAAGIVPKQAAINFFTSLLNLPPSEAMGLLEGVDDPRAGGESDIPGQGEDMPVVDEPASFLPPPDVSSNAADGATLKRQFKRGGGSALDTMARLLRSGEKLNTRKLWEMSSYYRLHAEDATEPSVEGSWNDPKNPSAAWIDWLLFGGDAGRDWVAEALSPSEDESEVGTVEEEDKTPGGEKIAPEKVE